MDQKDYQQFGAFVTIPFILAVPPIIGWLIGRWLDQKFETHPYLMFLLIFLGMIGGVRETYKIIKRFSEE